MRRSLRQGHSQRSGSKLSARGRPKARLCSSRASIQNWSSRCGPSIGTPRRPASSPTPPAWSIWAWVTRIFSISTPASAASLGAHLALPAEFLGGELQSDAASVLDLARAHGMDAGFGRGTTGRQVASFLVTRLRELKA